MLTHAFNEADDEGLGCVVWKGRCTVDEAGRAGLRQDIAKGVCFAPGSRVEIKLAGTAALRSLAIRWRSPAVSSTLQERMDVRGLSRKRGGAKWQQMTLGY